MIEWLTQAEFWESFEFRYRPEGRLLSEEVEVDAALVELRARIETAPVFTPASDGDFPGPVERWYGRVLGHLFLLTHYYEHSGRYTLLTIEPGSAARDAVVPAVRALLKSSPYSTAG